MLQMNSEINCVIDQPQDQVDSIRLVSVQSVPGLKPQVEIGSIVQFRIFYYDTDREVIKTWTMRGYNYNALRFCNSIALITAHLPIK